MDEHRKMALFLYDKIYNEHLYLDKIKHIEDALRTTASKSEKDGWNKSVEECINCCNDTTLEVDGLIPSDEFAEQLRRLIMEEGK